MTTSIFAAVVYGAWLLIVWWRECCTIETPWKLRQLEWPTRDWDRHSNIVWDVANLMEAVGLVLGYLGVGRFAGHGNLIALGGFWLLVMGLAISWTAIRTLGQLFTGVVMIQRDHRLIRTGPYRYVRHPSYAGLLIAHLGLGLAFVSSVSLVLSTIPFLVAATYRIHVEEQALAETFGEEFIAFSQETWRLIPWVY
jgi:protein-S-isoprenylcysteine O-methyltransferase